MPPINLPLGDANWRGLDARNKAQDIPDGFVQQSDNLYCDAGRWKLRPGLVGQWTSTVPDPIYAMEPVTQGNGDTVLWFATGPESDDITGTPSTWTGQIRTYTPGATSPSSALTLPTLLNDATGLVAKSVVIRQIGGFVYVADGTSTGLLRFPVDGSAGEVAQGLNKPGAPTQTGLQHLSLIPAPGRLAWAAHDVSTGGQLILGAGNDTPSGSNTAYDDDAEYWRGFSPRGISGDIDFGSFPDTGQGCVTLGGAVGVYVETTDAIKLFAGSDGEYPDIFELRFKARTKPGGDADTSRIKVTLSLFEDIDGADLLEDREQYAGLFTLTTTDYALVFDCRDLSTKPQSIKLRIENANAGIRGDDPMVSHFYLFTGGYKFRVPGTTSGSRPATLPVKSGSVYASPVGIACTSDTEELVEKRPQATKFFTRGRRFWTVFGSAQDYSGVQRIAASVNLAYPATDEVPVKLFIENSDGDRAYSPQTYLTPAKDTNLIFDITTADDTIRSAVTRLGIEFAEDVSTTAYAGDYRGYPDNSPVLLNVRFFTQPGNLTVDQTVRYRSVEWDSTGDEALLNVIQSDGSDFSSEITPTLTDAVGTVTLPARKNDNADYFALYRFGDFDDGYGRLIGLFPLIDPAHPTRQPFTDISYAPSPDKDIDKGKPPYYAVPANPFVRVTYIKTDDGMGETIAAPANAAGITVYDNTPASFLLVAQTYESGREQPPQYIREIVEWNNRLWLLADNKDDTRRRSELYGSWLLSADNNAGLYFSRSVSDADPSAPIKGFYSHIGTENGDKALRLVPIQDRLAILMERASPFIALGTDPTNLEIHAFAGDSPFSLGLVARNAAILFDGAVCYLTPDGLTAWSPLAAAQNLSERVRRWVTPRRTGLAPYNKTALDQAALWENGGCLYLSLPTAASDNAPNRILRFDPNEGSDGTTSVMGSWTVWTGISATGGVMLPGADTASGHYVATQSGMIALFQERFGDKTTSGASETAIAFTLVTRDYTAPDGFAALRPFRFDTEITNRDSDNALAITLHTAARANFWEQVYTIAAGATDSQPTTRISGVRGDAVRASFSGSSKRGVEIGRLRMHTSVGSERR